MSPSSRRMSAAAWNLLLCCGALLLATPARAYGYADPGSGTFIYQAAYALFLGGTYYLRRILDRVFKRNK